MKHQVTIISDDCRIEVGNKVSLLGIYDEAIVFKNLPSRLLKLAFYQRWTDFPASEKVVISIRGSALGDQEFSFDAMPANRPKPATPARITAIMGPIDFLREGDVEFRTFLNNEKEPSHSHKIEVKTDPTSKL
jgi:hypothetical protein